MKKNGYSLIFYCFQVYGFLYICAFFDLVFAYGFFSGGFEYIDLTIPRMNFINYVMAVFHLFKAVMFIATAIRMMHFRTGSEKMLIWLKASNLLLGGFYVFIRFFLTQDCNIYDLIAVFIITGIPLLINYLYYKKRESLFCE